MGMSLTCFGETAREAIVDEDEVMKTASGGKAGRAPGGHRSQRSL